VKLDSGIFEGNYFLASQCKEKKDTNPEKLARAAHAECFSWL